MSVKCNYSAKFLPLVKGIQLTNPEMLKEFLDTYFNDSDKLYSMFTEGVNIDTSPLIYKETKQIDNKLGLKIDSEIKSITEFYIGNQEQYEQVRRNFKYKIIESSIFNKNTEQFINANEIILGKNINQLNFAILNYKKTLADNIAKYLNINTLSEIDTNNLNKFDEELNNVITLFESNINSELVDHNSSFNNAYDAYVILTQFDKLLKSEIPFIIIDSKYKTSNNSYTDKYIYRGANVEHYTGFSTDENTNAEEFTSDLANILLDYLPEVNSIGSDIDGTNITLSGFNSVMTKLILAVNENENLVDYRNEILKGTQMNMPMLIDLYIKNIITNKIISPKYRTNLLNKLRGIKKFIYSEKMPTEIKAMFTQMALKTVPAQYVTYNFDPQKGVVASRDLKERTVSQQVYEIQNLIQASGYYWKSNPNFFKDKLKQYNINIQSDRIVINSIKDNIPTTFTIMIIPDSEGKVNYKVFGELNDQLLDKLVYEFMYFTVPDNFTETISQIYPTEKYSKTDLLIPLLATTWLEGNNNKFLEHQNGLVNVQPFLNSIWNVAKVLNVTNGFDTVNVIKNAEGNNLPVYQIISLVYNHYAIIDRLNNPPLEQIKHPTNVVRYNLIKQNIDNQFLLAPRIRSDVSINGVIKKPAKLTTNELLRLSIIYDFYQNLLDNNIVSLQPTTFADKNKHFLIPYNIDKTISTSLGDINIKEILLKYLSGSGDLNILYKVLENTRKNQINALVKNILFDYNTAFNTSFTTLSEVDDYIEKNKYTLKTIQDLFNSKGLDFFLDIHAYKTALSKYPRTNETIKNYYNIYNNEKNTLARLDREKKKFLKDILSSTFNLNINQDNYIRKIFTQSNFKEWVNKKNGNVILANVIDENGNKVDLDSVVDYNILLNPEWKITLNPILEAYFITDTLLSNEYNNMMVGGVYSHPNKNKDGKLDQKDYFEFSEASRLIAQYKRMVIYGATYHPFAQNLKNGVAPTIKIAIIDDMPGSAWNMLGEQNNKLDTMDGSGFASPLESRFENNSLLDAKVGRDKKTIMHDIDSRYDRPTLLKWAVYDISNERRRISQGSEISLDNIFKKTHSIPFNKKFVLEQYYNNIIYFKDINTGKYFKIVNIKTIFTPNGETIVQRDLVEVTSEGTELPNSVSDKHIINTLYDIDQLFGGAWAMSFNPETNTLEYSESNLDILENIVVSEDLKDNFIAYIVNKSAIKVGAGNINDVSKWNNEDQFTTIEMSTKFGGVQMDADHHLDMAEVTEMTQMLSALEQNGYTHELAEQIYKEIGQVVNESMQDLAIAVKSNNKDQVYSILGKSLVKSFMQDDKDVLGLAQSFVYLANESFKNANLNYKLPFSAATINGAFISTTTSNLVKKGIRRKYSGIASVLVPSYGIIQYYNIDGLNYRYDELYDIVDKQKINNLYDENGKIIKNKVDRALTEIFIDGVLNPYLIDIEPSDIDFEDTIVIFDKQNNTSIVKIDSLEKYYLYKYQAVPETKYFNWTIRPKNLKQSNTYFDIVTGVDDAGYDIVKRFSIYDLDSVRVSTYLRARQKQIKNWNDLTEVEKILLSSVLNLHPIENISINVEEILDTLSKITQLEITNLTDNNSIRNNTSFGIANPNVKTVKVSNIHVTPVQIVMGKRLAKQFGLKKGDSIAQIKKEKSDFFYNRMQNNYQISNPDKLSYDIVLFDGTGKQFYVKVLSSNETANVYQDSISFNSDFKIIDNVVYYGDTEVANNDEKQFYKYTDSNGNIHDLIIINSIDRLGELRKSGLVSTYQFNYTDQNVNILFPYQFKYNIDNNIPITLHTRDAMGNLQNIRINPLATSIRPQSLNNNEIFHFNQRLKQLAFNQYEAFEKSLLHIGTRIPSQSMQSFAPMEVVLFTDSEVNDVYVARAITWLEGSDYDIDKQYILGFSVKNNGTLYYPSKLAETYDLNEVHKLPIPNHKTYTIDNENGYYVSKEEVDDVLNRGILTSFKGILESEYNSIAFDELVSNKDKSKFIWELNKHSQTEMPIEYLNEGLKNRVVENILKLVLNPKNQINLHIPINMDDPQNAAKKSVLGKEEKYRTADNPASKFVMQEQNMSGKDVIGITAVSLKTYFLLSNYYNTKYREIVDLLKSGENSKAIALLDRLVFTSRFKSNNKGIVANTNLDPILKYLNDNKIETITLDNGEIVNIKQIVEQLKNNADVSDASLSISALLSAATDNAKELILSKINASAKFADIYTYLLITGLSFDRIAEIMTSPIFNYIVKVSDSNVFDESTYKFSVNSAIDFYLGENILPYLNRITFNNIVKEHLNNIKFESIINDIDKLKELENKILSNIPKSNKFQNNQLEEFDEIIEDDEYYNDDYYEDYEDYEDYYEEGYEQNQIDNSTLSRTDYINAYKAVHAFIIRKQQLDVIQNAEKQLKDLKFIKVDVLPAVEEMTILGAMGGINQGIRTNTFDKYNYIKRIETFVNKRFDSFYDIAEATSTTKILDRIRFNLMDFLSNPFMQNKYIDLYDKSKKSFNILEAIVTVPHFKEMFQVLYLDKTSINSLSVLNYLEDEIANNLVDSKNKLNQKEFKEVTKYINDLLIYNWIRTLNKSIHIPIGQKYFFDKFGNIKTNELENFSIQLDTVENIASFKRLMDEYIIPTLKSDSNFEDNLFIKSLVWGISKNKYSEQPNIFYKLPLNMMQIDSSLKNQTFYESILHDFNLLNGKTFDGWNIIDLFYLYNLIINKDSFGQSSFVRLFEDLTKLNTGDLLATQFYNYLSNLDYSDEKDINYDIRDIKYRIGLITNNPNKFSIQKNNKTGEVTVEGITQNPKNINTNYFTFNMPFLDKYHSNVAKSNLTPIKSELSYYEKHLNTTEIINAIINRLKNIYPQAQVQIITDENIKNINDVLVRNSEAFIENGKIFINIDKANITAPLHEFTHLILAGIKENNPEVYYNILSSIITHPKYNEIASNPAYKNKHGSDLDEEVFATILGEYFKNKIYNWDGNDSLTNTDNITKQVINQILDINVENINIQSLMNTPLNELLEIFSSGIISGNFADLINLDYIKLNQKLASIKNKLISDKTIKEECYE